MPRRARRYMGRRVTSWPLKMTLPSLGVIWPGGHAEAGGLAGAVGAEQADDLAGVDLEVDAVHDLAAGRRYLTSPVASRIAIVAASMPDWGITDLGIWGKRKNVFVSSRGAVERRQWLAARRNEDSTLPPSAAPAFLTPPSTSTHRRQRPPPVSTGPASFSPIPRIPPASRPWHGPASARNGLPAGRTVQHPRVRWPPAAAFPAAGRRCRRNGPSSRQVPCRSAARCAAVRSRRGPP